MSETPPWTVDGAARWGVCGRGKLRHKRISGMLKRPMMWPCMARVAPAHCMCPGIPAHLDRPPVSALKPADYPVDPVPNLRPPTNLTYPPLTSHPFLDEDIHSCDQLPAPRKTDTTTAHTTSTCSS